MTVWISLGIEQIYNTCIFLVKSVFRSLSMYQYIKVWIKYFFFFIVLPNLIGFFLMQDGFYAKFKVTAIVFRGPLELYSTPLIFVFFSVSGRNLWTFVFKSNQLLIILSLQKEQ